MQGSLSAHLCRTSYLPAGRHHLNCNYTPRVIESSPSFKDEDYPQTRWIFQSQVLSLIVSFWEWVREISKLPCCWTQVVTRISHYPGMTHWTKCHRLNVPQLFSKLVNNHCRLSLSYVKSKGWRPHARETFRISWAIILPSQLRSKKKGKCLIITYTQLWGVVNFFLQARKKSNQKPNQQFKQTNCIIWTQTGILPLAFCSFTWVLWRVHSNVFADSKLWQWVHPSNTKRRLRGLNSLLNKLFRPE